MDAVRTSETFPADAASDWVADEIVVGALPSNKFN